MTICVIASVVAGGAAEAVGVGKLATPLEELFEGNGELISAETGLGVGVAVEAGPLPTILNRLLKSFVFNWFC